MRYSGRLWTEDEGESSAGDGVIEISNGHVKVEMASVEVGRWPLRTVDIEGGGLGRHVLIVSGRRLVFEPNRPRRFADEARAVVLSNELAFSATPAGQAVGGRKALRRARHLRGERDPGIAALASFVWAGLGQIYVGKRLLGTGFALAQIANLWLIRFGIGYVTFMVVWVVAIVHAFRAAEASLDSVIEDDEALPRAR